MNEFANSVKAEIYNSCNVQKLINSPEFSGQEMGSVTIGAIAVTFRLIKRSTNSVCVHTTIAVENTENYVYLKYADISHDNKEKTIDNITETIVKSVIVRLEDFISELRFLADGYEDFLKSLQVA